MELPKRYSLSIEVKLIELPDQFREPDEPPPDDPVKLLTVMGQRALAMPAVPVFQQPQGFDWRKNATITVTNFLALAKVLEQYDELTRRIESETP